MSGGVCVCACVVVLNTDREVFAEREMKSNMKDILTPTLKV